MASTTSAKKICATCHKVGDVYVCRGCRQTFCEKDIDEHRNHLNKQLEHLIEDYDGLKNDLDQDQDAESLLNVINSWEHQSIAKICLAAENIRIELNEWLQRNHQSKQTFEQILNELQTCQKSDDFNETDLQRWSRQLEDFRRRVEFLPNIQPTDDNETIHLVKFQDNLEQERYSHIDTRTPSVSPSIYSLHDASNNLVRERFADVYGQASILEDGLLANYSDHWLGESNICGVNLYSSGTHHIRFRLVEKFYDTPFFGIITASQKNTENILESTSANGWLNLDCSIVNGKKESRTGRDKIIRSLDELTLTLDCDRRQIFLKHHRSKRLLHIPIDLRSCPFPWKMLIVLYRRGDSVRIIGGSISVHRNHLTSRNRETTQT